MADKKATILLQLKDKVSQGLGKVGGALKKFKQNWLAVSAAIAGVTAFALDSVKAFIKQEDAVEKLNQALKNQGIFTKKASEDIQQFAAELQKVTTVGDETIIEMSALLTTFGLTGDEMKRTTETALDLSAGLGIDLKAATLLLGKAFAGDITTLSRYGIKIDENIPKAEQFTAVMQKLNERFGGSARAQLNTFGGRIKNLTGRLGDLKEKIGKEIIPVFESWARGLESVVGWVERLSQSETDNLSGRELTIQALEKEAARIKEQAELRAMNHDGIVRLTEAERERLILITDSLIREKALLDEQTKIQNKKVQVAEQTTDAIEKDLATSLSTQDKQQKEAAAKQLADTISANDRLIAEFVEFHRQQEESERQLQEFKRQQFLITASSFQTVLGQIRTIAGKETKALFIIDKASALASAVVNTAQGATKALALGPFIGPPLAGLIKALGAVQIGIIGASAIRGFQEGGIVQPQAGGSIARIAEAGKPEAVIPLEDREAKEKLADVFGGVTININAGTIVGDDFSVREFAQRIDEELFALKRNRESVVFD